MEQIISTASIQPKPHTPPSGHPKVTVAMAYVPDQAFENILESNMGFEVGTIFSALYLPFTGKEPK